jgi:L-threonylcarbamoyladenylate synthase
MRLVSADDPVAIEAAAEALSAGELVVVPTETVYGLTSALTESALARLFEAKGRDADKTVTLLVASIEQVRSLVHLSEAAELLAERFWPGPLTLVLPLRPGAALPVAVVGSDEHGPTAGFRLPDHPLPRALAERLGPLPLSSANRSGRPAAADAAAAAVDLGESVALVLDGGPAGAGIPSTVVRLSPEGHITVLREGAVPESTLRQALGPAGAPASRGYT